MKVAVIPIFRSYWLWHALAQESKHAVVPTPSWRTGRNLEEKFQLFTEHLKAKFQERLMKEWVKLETAKQGSLRNRGYRLAQAVLAREDPRETFLKAVPDAPASFQVIAPDAFPERLVRRRLRLLAAASQHRHQRGMVLWLLGLIPQAPILLTPLPAITIYYTAYRFYSHYRALQGCRALHRMFLELDSAQLSSLRERLLDMQASDAGLKVESGTWVSKLLEPKHQYLDLFQQLKEAQQKEELARHRVDHPMLDAELGEGRAFGVERSRELTDILQPDQRRSEPLSDEAAVEAARLLQAPFLLEGVARARKRMVGAMFPTKLPSE